MSDVKTYLDVISAYEREFEKWENRSKKIIDRYRDDKRKRDAETKFNILWSNVQTLVPACFSRIPQPDVSRRFRDNDPVGRVAALILERALDFEVQHYADYRTTMKQSVYDRFLGGRGTSWARYEPIFKPLQITEDIEDEEPQEQLDYECAPTDYVHWKDFGHEVARTWEEVTKVWRKVYMSEKAVTKRFGDKVAKKIPYDASPEDKNKKSDVEIKKQALIYELWDKENKTAVWLSKSLKDEVIEELPDPLNLHEFFPCPRPLFATTTNETLVPVPDFTLYQDQANDLDTLADRIGGLIQMLQVKGTYDGSVPELARLFTEGNNNGTLIAVKNFAAFAEKQGLKGALDLVDLAPIAQALQIAVEAFQQKKGEVDELSGVIDVMRGNVDPEEKLGQTQMKGATASLRLRDTQEAVARYATEILQLKAQIICSKFNPETIKAMAAVTQLNEADAPYVDQALMLLVGEERMMNPDAQAPNPMRSFRIEIAADSLVQMDEQEEKQSRMEFLQANGDFMAKSTQMLAGAGPAAPMLLPVVMELWKFGITGFKVGKSIEGALDQAADQLKQLAAQPQAAPVDPKVMEEQAMQQAKQQVMAENAAKEVAINKRSADQDVREMALQNKEKELALQEQLAQQQIKMQEEHSKKMLDADRQSMERDREHQTAMDGVTQKENELSLREEVTKHTADLEKKTAVADERLKANESASKEAQDNRGELTSAVKELVQAQGKAHQLISSLADAHKELAKQVTRPRKNTLHRGPDGKATHAMSEPA